MSLIPLVLASVDATISQGGDEVSVAATIDQLRDDVVAGMTDVNATVAYSNGAVLILDAVTSAVRWTGVRIMFDGVELPPGAFHGSVQIDETLGQPRTARFAVIGHLWALPTQDDPLLGPFESRSWGNKPVEIYLAFGASPLTMVWRKVFQGVTLQKSNRGDTSVLGEIGCVDDSLKSANIALCYSLNPFGGKTRDEIVRELAALAGFAEDQVFVPAGAQVTKPILLTNGSLMPLLAEFGVPENWVPTVDVYGNLRVIDVELKEEPDWIIDAREGGYDLDTITEQPPAMAPRRYYAHGTAPVGAGGPEIEVETNDVVAVYNPLCVKVRPSTLPSYLQVDGSYRALAVAEVMTIGRTETERTILAGREVRRVVKTYGMYNPYVVDPNYSTGPPGTDYDGAYGDETFHRDEVESLMETHRETITSQYSVFGALERRVLEVQEWHAPKAEGNFPVRLDPPVTNAGALQYVYSDRTTRRYPEEIFHTVQTVERQYVFAGDGTLNAVTQTITDWNAPLGRTDVLSGGVVDQEYDYKYSENDWRSEIEESFLVREYTEDTYYAPGGVLSDIRQIVHDYVNPQAAVPADPLSSPPYLFADGTWRIYPAYIYNNFRPRSTTTSFREHGVGTHEIITTTADPLTGTSASTVQVVSGPIPGVPTAGSLMTGLVLRPIFATLIDPALDEFVDSKKALSLPWAETTGEIERATLRQMRRDSAIVRTRKMAANPLIELAQTIRAIDPKRSQDGLELVTGKTITYELESGDCTMALTSEVWVR